MESAYMFVWRAPYDTHIAPRRGRRSLPQIQQQMFKSWAQPLRQHLYAAVAFVASVAAQGQRVRLLHHKIAEAHPLHPPMNIGVQLFYNIIALLAHTSHDSILPRAYQNMLTGKNVRTKIFSSVSATTLKMVRKSRNKSISRDVVLYTAAALSILCHYFL